MPGGHIAVAVSGPPQVGVGPVDLRLGGTGGVQRHAGIPVQEHIVGPRLLIQDRGGLGHGSAGPAVVPEQGRAALPVPEQIGAGCRRVLTHPVLALAQQLPPPPAAQGETAHRQAAAKLSRLQPVTARGLELLIAHGCLPSASS